MSSVILTKAIISRNVKDFKFCSKLTQDKANELIGIVKNALPDFKEVSSDETRALIERDLLLNDNKVILFNETSNVAITLLDGEHISIVSSSLGYDMSAYNRAKQVADVLSNKISMCYNDQYGYLMSDVSKLGSGVHLECEISLPIINSLDKINQLAYNIKHLGYGLKETENKDIFTIATRCNLGIKEQDVVQEFEKMISNIESIENESLNVYKLENNDRLVDQFYRSCAVLQYSHLMSAEELISRLINIQIGLNLNLNFEKIDYEKVVKLFALARFFSTKAHDIENQLELSIEIGKIL